MTATITLIIIGIANAQSPRIVILDFETGEGITQSHATSLTAILTAYLQEEYEVISPITLLEETNRIINELGFQQATMTDEQVAIVDSILNVEKVIFGSINLARGQYRLLASVINTQTGTIRPVVGVTGNASAVRAFPRVAQSLAPRLMAEMERSEIPVPQEVAVETLLERDTGRGILINGVRWATRNVDSRVGTFVASPEMAGRLNAWNSRFDWNIVWFGGSGRGSPAFWQNMYDPCPRGWRIPYRDELEALVAAGSFWTTVNGVGGRVFGTAPNQIFLPAAGGGGVDFDLSMSHIPTHTAHEGQIGYYWARNAGNWILKFSQADAVVGISVRGSAFSVRCVVRTNNIYIEF